MTKAALRGDAALVERMLVFELQLFGEFAGQVVERMLQEKSEPKSWSMMGMGQPQMKA